MFARSLSHHLPTPDDDDDDDDDYNDDDDAAAAADDDGDDDDDDGVDCKNLYPSRKQHSPPLKYFDRS